MISQPSKTNQQGSPLLPSKAWKHPFSAAIGYLPLGFLTALFLLGINMGCGKVLSIHYYDFRYPSPAPLFSPPKITATLGVAPFTAPFSYRQSRLLYREGPNETKVGFYEDRRWAGSPTELITLAAVNHLRLSGLFDKVILRQGDTSTDYLLQGKIVELDEVDRTDGYYTQVGLEVELYESGKNRKLIWAGTIKSQRKTTVRDMDAIAGEMALTVGDAIQSLAAKLGTVLNPSATK